MAELEEESSLNLNETAAWLISFLTRRRWWILLPFCGITLTTLAALSLLPNRYTSSATLLVVQQQVPQRYVVPNSTTDVTSALQAMKQEILSRTQLLRMIDDFNLYPKQRKRYAPEQLVALMLSNIDTVPMNENPQQQKDIDSFQISFTTENPVVAQQVTNHLTSLFINEYLRSGADQAANTTNFLHQQVENKGKELQAQEERLRDFKLQHIGELPEQQAGNLGILTGLNGQLQNTMASLLRAQQQHTLLLAQLQATPRRRTPEPAAPGVVADPSNPTRLADSVEIAQNDIVRLQAARSAMRAKGWTPQHPDMLRNQREIAQAEDTLRRARAAAPPPEKHSAVPATTVASTAIDPGEDPAVIQLKSSLEANRLEIENLSNEEKRLKASIGAYEGRLNQTPVREQQEAGIVRDTEVLRAQYSDLQKKEQDSQLATNLEKQQGGQQFRLIDPASLPTVPSSPKRGKMSLGGTAAGFAVGLALAFLLEMRDTSFRSDKEVIKHLSPPFVLTIPMLPTLTEERRQRGRIAVEWIAASAMLAVVAAAELFVYRRG